MVVVTYWGHVLGIAIETELRRRAFDHLQKLSFRFFDNQKTGHLIGRLTRVPEEIGKVAHLLPPGIKAQSAAGQRPTVPSGGGFTQRRTPHNPQSPSHHKPRHSTRSALTRGQAPPSVVQQPPHAALTRQAVKSDPLEYRQDTDAIPQSNLSVIIGKLTLIRRSGPIPPIYRRNRLDRRRHSRLDRHR